MGRDRTFILIIEIDFPVSLFGIDSSDPFKATHYFFEWTLRVLEVLHFLNRSMFRPILAERNLSGIAKVIVTSYYQIYVEIILKKLLNAFPG